MPLRQCQINNKPGYAWGRQGKCYEYDPTDDQSKIDAKKKAIAQGVAIGDMEALGAQIGVVRGTYKFAIEKISFDFDGTLSTRKGQELWKSVGGDYVITARSRGSLDEVYAVTDRLGIPRSKVFATGGNHNKVIKVKELGVTIHYDNNQDVVNNLPGIGKLFHT